MKIRCEFYSGRRFLRQETREANSPAEAASRWVAEQQAAGVKAGFAISAGPASAEVHRSDRQWGVAVFSVS